jgi:transcriptional regulator with GAF, ATPase, and Fis domain
MRRETVELKQKPSHICDVDLLRGIAEHVAKGDTFDETLASVIDIVVRMFCCDECIAYVREGQQLIPWVWKYSEDRSVEQARLAVDHDCVRALSEHLQPIAVSRGVRGAFQVRIFNAWSTHPGETSVWIPFAARSELLGALLIEHRRPRVYDRREINLLSSMGRLLGADIRISQLRTANSDLVLQLETRNLVERGKGILQRDFGLSEEEAYLALQRQSRQKRRSMNEVAQAIILSDEVRRSSLQAE